MANIIKIQEYSNNLAVLLDDDTKILCYPTGNGLWIPAISDGPGPEPSDDFKFPFPRSQHTTYAGHSGADWPVNADIPCIGNGTVVQRFEYSGNTYPGDSSEPIWRGNCLVINHGSIGGHEIWSLYAHMRDAPSLSEGNSVNGGQIIGHTGNTGFSNGTHLHFEIIYDGVRLQTGQGGYERTINWMDANTDGSSW